MGILQKESYFLKKGRGHTKILVLGDMHNPYMDWELFAQVVEFYKIFKPDYVVQIGDILDAKAWSRFPKGTNDDSADEEWDKSELAIHRIHEAIPEMQIKLGNHELRIPARAKDVFLPKKLLKTFDEYFDFDGWTWNYTAPIIIDDITFVHGDEIAGTTPRQKAMQIGGNLVYGHTHQALIEYISTFNRQIFSFNCGWMGDKDSVAMEYASRNVSKCTAGFGYIEDGVPMFIPKQGGYVAKAEPEVRHAPPSTKGISYAAGRQKWRLILNGQHLGYFDTKEEAEKAAHKAKRG